jgi:hypothetical protein
MNHTPVYNRARPAGLNGTGFTAAEKVKRTVGRGFMRQAGDSSGRPGIHPVGRGFIPGKKRTQKTLGFTCCGKTQFKGTKCQGTTSQLAEELHRACFVTRA